MGQFQAWAVRGQVTKLRTWSDAQDRSEHSSDEDGGGTVRIATRLLRQQRFLLRPRDGVEIGVHLTESGIELHNGDMVTVVWAARAGSVEGRCVFVENHRTGAIARLANNVGLIRPTPNFREIARYGGMATIPSLVAITAWLFVPGSLAEIDGTYFLIGASVTMAVMFAIGAIVAKLLLDYRRGEDEEGIWTAVREALAASKLAQLPAARASRRL
jgi:hypothetical protein